MIFKSGSLFGKTIDFEVKNGKFEKIGKLDFENHDNAEIIDLKGAGVYPGLVDIHTHGCVGFDTMDASFEKMAEFQLKNGVTCFLPTTMTMPVEKIKEAVTSDVSKYKNIGGFHLEGPYINEKYKGAQNKDYIKNPDLNDFANLESVKIVTLAPESNNAINYIKNSGFKIALGHTSCDYDTAINAIDAGADCVTHIFNAMPPMHHRNPSLIGAAIEKDIFAQVICDGLHIHKSVIKMLYKTFTSDKLILISDSMRATGLCDGEYEFGGQQITVSGGVARTKDGTIAGSTSSLLDCVKKAIEFNIPKEEAFKMASDTPAKYINVKKGKFESGYDADFFIADDKLNVLKTYIGGKIVYEG